MKTYAYPPQAVEQEQSETPFKPKTLADAPAHEAWSNDDGGPCWHDGQGYIYWIGGTKRVLSLNREPETYKLSPNTQYMGEVVGVLLRK